MKAASETYQTIEYIIDDDVATVHLNRPQRYNSFSDEMHVEMRAVLKQIARDKNLRCLVITGNGKGFCTGQDLNGRYELVKAGRPDLGESLRKNYNPLIQQIVKLNIPVVCAVNGIAAGAGIGLALACDIVVAAESASFVFAFSKVGLAPDSGCSWALAQAVGLPRAKALCMLGDTFTAAEALNSGLIWQCVADEDLESSVKTLVQRLRANPAQGLALTKRALQDAGSKQLNEQLMYEAQLQTVAGRTDDYAEAVCAFIEKRKPVFSGK